MISLKDVSVSRNGVTLLDRANLEIGRGEFIFLVGQDALGTTLLLRLLLMDISPDSGSTVVGDYNSGTIKPKQLPLLRRQVAIVERDPVLLSDRNVYDNVAFALLATDVKKSLIRDRVLRALDDVGLAEKATEMPSTLSLGEQLRVAIARACVNKPMLLLADDPTGNLDPAESSRLLDLPKRICNRGLSILFVTLKYELVKRIPARILLLKSGKLLEVELNVQDG